MKFLLTILLFPAIMSAQIEIEHHMLDLPIDTSFSREENTLLNTNMFKDINYKWTKKKSLALGITILASAIDGFLEGYGFDQRKYFEIKYNVPPISFFGSESWRLRYVNGDPAQGYVNWWAKHMGATDFYHIMDDGRKFTYVGAGICIVIGAKGQSFKAHVLDAVIYSSASMLSKNIAMRKARKP